MFAKFCETWFCETKFCVTFQIVISSKVVYVTAETSAHTVRWRTGSNELSHPCVQYSYLDYNASVLMRRNNVKKRRSEF